MAGIFARLRPLTPPTCPEERRAAERRTREQERLARIDVDTHRFHRERNHFSERIGALMREETRWS